MDFSKKSGWNCIAWPEIQAAGPSHPSLPVGVPHACRCSHRIESTIDIPCLLENSYLPIMLVLVLDG